MDDSSNVTDNDRLIIEVNKTINRLKELWDEVSMEEAAKVSRVACAYMHIYTLLSDIVTSEENMVSGVKSDIEARRLAISDIRAMLKMPEFDDSAYPENSIALLRALEKELVEITKKHDDAVALQIEEFDLLKAVCDRLDVDIPVDSYNIEISILSAQSLAALKSKLKETTELLEKRVNYINSIQTECRKLYNALKESISFSPEQQNLLNNDFTTPNAIVSEDVVESIEKLQTFMIDAYSNWIEQATFQYSEALIAYRTAAEKCGMEQNDLVYPDIFDPERQDQSSIDKLQKEAKRMEARYERGASVYDAFARWRQLWQEKLIREDEASDPQFYNNRGGQLNDFLKRQKQLNVMVPNAMTLLRTTVHKFIDQGGDVSDILIEDVRPDEYADFLQSEHNERKKLQKTLKVHASAAPLNKRRVSGRIKVAAGKVARRRMSRRLSIISPVKSMMENDVQGGPKTSSPKYIASPLTKFSTPRTPMTSGTLSSTKFITPGSNFASPKTTQTIKQRKSRLPKQVHTLPRLAHYTTQSTASLHTTMSSRTRTPLTASTSRIPLRQIDSSQYGSSTKLNLKSSKPWRY